jgi:single-strand DNA-binding protein
MDLIIFFFKLIINQINFQIMNNILHNNVNLIGNLGQDIQLINFESGNKKASFSLATSESYKNKDGEYVKNTQWHNVVAWGKQAELLSRSLSKGNKIAVQGTLQYRTYVDKDGKTQYVAEVVMNEFVKINTTRKAESLEMAAEPAPF